MSQKREHIESLSPRKEARLDAKSRYAAYKEEGNRFLRDKTIVRKSAKTISDQSDNIVFEWIDVDLYDGLMMKRVDATHVAMDPDSERCPVIRFFGITNDGHSVCANVHNFLPYISSLHPHYNHATDKEDFMCYLTNRMKERKCAGRVLDIEMVKRKNIYLYHENDEEFMKITLQFPVDVPPCRDILHLKGSVASEFKNYRAAAQAKALGQGPPPPASFASNNVHLHDIFEAKLPFVMRFMVDHKIVGCNWLELKAGSYRLLPEAERRSTCQYECDVLYTDLVSHSTQDEFSHIAPYRIFSFDIECCAEEGGFPEPEKDAVITIANVITEQGSTEPLFKSVFTMGSCSSIPGVEVYAFEDEAELLAAWARYMVACDPDIITGYNIQNFDIDYLMKRAAALKVPDFPLLGRIKGEHAKSKNTVFSSSAYGMHENVETTIAGRLVFDLLQFVRREYKLSSYTLNNVSSEFLGQHKEDVKYNQIKDLYHGDEVTRQRIASYCVKDALLPQQLLDKLNVIINQVEMARVSGVPINLLLSRGQQIKVMSMLSRKSIELGYIIPTLDRTQQDQQYEGATVIEPKKGFYKEPIATLDFASLYPSIMIAHNICYSTLVPRGLDIDPARVEAAPTGERFVRSSEREGVLPIILRELLAARKVAKKDMAKETDPLKKAVQNGRQLALKISANSVYGFTGAVVGQLPCLAISKSVTAYGRQMIDMTQKTVMEHYSVKNGYKHDAVIVYGDTDSVMVKFGVETVEEAMQIGKEAAALVSERFPNPVRLEFEKVYCPYLLMNKKRYAGLFWTKPDHWDKLDAKGIETVRRDNCRLVRILVDTCLKKMLIDRSPEDAVEYVKNTLSALLQNQIDLSLLVITKALGKKADGKDGKKEGYKTRAAHVELAERMAKRDPGSAPKVGDRVPYVIIQKEKNAQAYMKSEDPIYVLDHNLSIDTEWYLNHQLRGPIERIFEGVLADSTLKGLFQGDHMNVKKVVTSQNTGIGRFVSKQNTCLKCKCPLKSGAVCQNCKQYESQYYVQTAMQVELQERQYCELWTTCQRCQNSLHQEIICGNKDCPIYYQREKIKKDLETSMAKLKRFSEYSCLEQTYKTLDAVTRFCSNFCLDSLRRFSTMMVKAITAMRTTPMITVSVMTTRSEKETGMLLEDHRPSISYLHSHLPFTGSQSSWIGAPLSMHHA